MTAIEQYYSNRDELLVLKALGFDQKKLYEQYWQIILALEEAQNLCCHLFTKNNERCDLCDLSKNTKRYISRIKY